jgi:hypothetical protein
MKTAVLEGAIESGCVYTPGALWANTETVYGGCACTPGFNSPVRVATFCAATTEGVIKEQQEHRCKERLTKGFSGGVHNVVFHLVLLGVDGREVAYRWARMRQLMRG